MAAKRGCETRLRLGSEEIIHARRRDEKGKETSGVRAFMR